MWQFFDKRGYPVSVIRVGHHRAQQIDWHSALATGPERPIKITVILSAP